MQTFVLQQIYFVYCESSLNKMNFIKIFTKKNEKFSGNDDWRKWLVHLHHPVIPVGGIGGEAAGVAEELVTSPWTLVRAGNWTSKNWIQKWVFVCWCDPRCVLWATGGKTSAMRIFWRIRPKLETILSIIPGASRGGHCALQNVNIWK